MAKHGTRFLRRFLTSANIFLRSFKHHVAVLSRTLFVWHDLFRTIQYNIGSWQTCLVFVCGIHSTRVIDSSTTTNYNEAATARTTTPWWCCSTTITSTDLYFFLVGCCQLWCQTSLVVSVSVSKEEKCLDRSPCDQYHCLTVESHVPGDGDSYQH